MPITHGPLIEGPPSMIVHEAKPITRSIAGLVDPRKPRRSTTIRRELQTLQLTRLTEDIRGIKI